MTLNSVPAPLQFLNLVSALCALTGSYLYVKNQFVSGSKIFILGNVTNLAVSLATGNLGLATLMAAFVYYTAPIYVNDDDALLYNLSSLTLFVVLFQHLQLSTAFQWEFDILSTLCAAIAIYGAHQMLRGNLVQMSIAWIVADLGFFVVGVLDGLWGLAIQSLFFVWHGYLRLRASRPVTVAPLVAP